MLAALAFVRSRILKAPRRCHPRVALHGAGRLRPVGARVALLQAVDVLGRLRLGQRRRELLAGLAGQGVQVALLRLGHGLVAGDPVVGVTLQRLTAGRPPLGDRRTEGLAAGISAPLSVVAARDLLGIGHARPLRRAG